MPDPTPAPDEMVVVAVPKALVEKVRARRESQGDTAVFDALDVHDAVLAATPIDLDSIRREERAKAIEEAAKIATKRRELWLRDFSEARTPVTGCERARFLEAAHIESEIRALATAQGGKGGAA